VRAAVETLLVNLSPLGDGPAPLVAVERCAQQAMVALGAPSDYGAFPDEYRLRLDDYFPVKSKRARREGETPGDRDRRVFGVKL